MDPVRTRPSVHGLRQVRPPLIIQGHVPLHDGGGDGVHRLADVQVGLRPGQVGRVPVLGVAVVSPVKKILLKF